MYMCMVHSLYLLVMGEWWRLEQAIPSHYIIAMFHLRCNCRHCIGCTISYCSCGRHICVHHTASGCEEEERGRRKSLYYMWVPFTYNYAQKCQNWIQQFSSFILTYLCIWFLWIHY